MASQWLDTFRERTEKKDTKGIRSLFHKDAILFGRFTPKPSDTDFDLENAKILPFPPACMAVVLSKPSEIVSNDSHVIRWTFVFVIDNKAFQCVHAHCSRSTNEQLIIPPSNGCSPTRLSQR